MNKINQNINTYLNNFCGTKFILRPSKNEQYTFLDYDNNLFLSIKKEKTSAKKALFNCENREKTCKLKFILNERKDEDFRVKLKKTQSTFFLKNKNENFFIRTRRPCDLKKPINEIIYFIRNHFIKQKISKNKLLFLNLAYNIKNIKNHFLAKIKFLKVKSYLFTKFTKFTKKFKNQELKKSNVIELKNKKLYAINKYINFQKKLKRIRLQKLRVEEKRLLKNKQQQRKKKQKIKQ